MRQRARRSDDVWAPPSVGDGHADGIASSREPGTGPERPGLDGPGPDGPGPTSTEPGRQRSAGPRRFGPIQAGPAVAGLICALAMVAVGPLIGLLWAATAPRLDLEAALGGSESAFDAQAGADAYFGLICLVAGIVGGLVAYWRGREAGWPVPVGLGLGGVGGALLAEVVGHALRAGEVRHKVPGASGFLVSLLDFRVRSAGLFTVLPGAALLTLAIALWFTTRFGRAD